MSQRIRGGFPLLESMIHGDVAGSIGMQGGFDGTISSKPIGSLRFQSGNHHVQATG